MSRSAFRRAPTTSLLPPPAYAKLQKDSEKVEQHSRSTWATQPLEDSDVLDGLRKKIETQMRQSNRISEEESKGR